MDWRAGRELVSPDRGDMREADMKCRWAVYLLPIERKTDTPEVPSLLRFPPIAARVTRSRKVAAEEAFCCELVISVSFQEHPLMLRYRFAW
jgi:hypothetical protein